MFLGFVEAFEPFTTSPPLDSFPSKVGGLPIWLDPQHPLTSDSLLCNQCSSIMPLLLQMYTPNDDIESAYHRVVYLFICKNGKCSTSNTHQSIRAFTYQLPELNKYTTQLIQPTHAHLCEICGLKGTKKCGDCLSAFYCSQDHQRLAWASHKPQCKSETSIQSSTPTSFGFTLPEFDIVIESEPEKTIYNDKEHVQGELESMIDDMNFDGDEEEQGAQDTKVNVDTIFIKFQKRVEREPDQVIRISHQPKDAPLWVNENGKPLDKDIGVCECGGKRVFEMQVMPQLIGHLNQGNNPDSMDWGTLFVYTCERFCDKGEGGYVEQFVWKQDFYLDGMRNPNEIPVEKNDGTKIKSEETKSATDETKTSDDAPIQ